MKNRRTEQSAGGWRLAAGGGYTLLELLVAMTIMIVLGAGLVALLKEGIQTWHVAEKRGAIYDRARMVLDQIGEDLRAVAGDSSARGDGFWIRFICDADPSGRPRLRFTRAISGEAQDPIGREGGRYLETGSGSHHDQHDDAQDVEEGTLLPPAGYQEVLYVQDPDPEKSILWRGERSPIGGPGSFFVDRNIEPEEPAPKPGEKVAARGSGEARSGVALAESASASKGAAPRSDLITLAHEESPLGRAARPFAREILHLSFAFWTPWTNTWDHAQAPRQRTSAEVRSGPVSTWDSTRAVLDEKAPSGEFAFRRVEGSLDDPFDDVFPERVEVTLVVAGNADVPLTVLAQDIGPSDREIQLSRAEGFPEEGPNRFVKIDGEWIGYEKIERAKLVLPAAASKTAAGRGARGTVPGRHARGATVELGTTFRRVVEIPAVVVGRRDESVKRRHP
jgi:hypothetical protein